MEDGANPPNPHAWAELPASEITETAARSGSIAVIPFGSVEQHGPHLPTGTDALLAEAIAELGAERVGSDVPILTLPAVWTGFAPHHQSFGGTVTADLETLLRLLREVVGSAAACGFDAAVVLNGHGGNSALTSVAVDAVGEEYPSVVPYGLTYFELAAPFVDEIRESERGGMAHAGEFETSLMMHLRPELVGDVESLATYREERNPFVAGDLFETGLLSTYRPFEAYTETGVVGDPTAASAETGEVLYRGLGEEFEAVLRAIHEEVR